MPDLVEECTPFVPRYMLLEDPVPEQSIKPNARSYQKGVSLGLSWGSAALNLKTLNTLLAR
ncbi:hypothetical protein N7519_007388 [Penicillium mononematosum]|uniref:uncharacterized protein n=1 Tax=Penicillium mononematosum TaxID=268346 RepID=UPI002546A83D|nr:uncharacterized protein N7519_007388 [Penicillium mononematosum]KAJ6186087.1 hypothetical protein N7519_007388 [Penicillium mononematosum]